MSRLTPDIVLVDDDAAVHTLVERLIRRSERRLTSYSDPIEARAGLVGVVASLLIVDGHMPLLDGLDLLESLATDGELVARRSLLCSVVRPCASDLERAHAIGVEFMTKSELFDRRRFHATITSDAGAA